MGVMTLGLLFGALLAPMAAQEAEESEKISLKVKIEDAEKEIKSIMEDLDAFANVFDEIDAASTDTKSDENDDDLYAEVKDTLDDVVKLSNTVASSVDKPATGKDLEVLDKKQLKDILRTTKLLRADLLSLQQDGVKGSCSDDDKGVFEASHEKAADCEEALRLYKLNGAQCSDDLGFGSLEDLCPATCGVCATSNDVMGKMEILQKHVTQMKLLFKEAEANCQAASGTAKDPIQQMKELSKEVMDRFKKGELFTPLLESFKEIQEQTLQLLNGTFAMTA
mmetsp:Transcript_7617/g.11533  ORF Transcript_7617/g.11533 Transcript_7617/m.11533 type:complete len:280 (-) Transcript_7617:66-905(-)